MTPVGDSPEAPVLTEGAAAVPDGVAEAKAFAAPARPRKTFDRSLVEGPIGPAVWKIAWPTMLQNIIAGLQGIIDHAMVGHFVGYTANAAIGVSWQIVIVVIVFASTVFSGMGVLVARFAGANQPHKVNRVVYQSFLTAGGDVVTLGAAGWSAAPSLLGLVNAAPDVALQALPFLRPMLAGILGMMVFFMLSGAFRAAGDSRTPLRLGVMMTALTIVFNVVLIPLLGTLGAALGTIASSTIVSVYGLWRMTRPESVIHFEPGMSKKPDLADHSRALPFRPADGLPGHRDERRRRAPAAVHRIAPAERRGPGGLCRRVHRAVLADHLDVRRPDGRRGRDLRPEPGRGPARSGVEGVWVASRIGLGAAAVGRRPVSRHSEPAPRLFGLDDPAARAIGQQLLRYLAVSGLFVTVALCYTGALQGTGDTRGPLYISIVSQIVVPLGLCAVLQATGGLTAGGIWTAIVLGHMTRCALSVGSFRLQRWRGIAVAIPS